jgi:hypothetical protein
MSQAAKEGYKILMVRIHACKIWGKYIFKIKLLMKQNNFENVNEITDVKSFPVFENLTFFKESNVILPTMSVKHQIV